MSAMKNSGDVYQTVTRYADTVRRICVLYLKNYHDTEDIFQTVFLKYMTSSTEFESDKKAWIIRVTINACKDFLKSFHRKNMLPLEAAQNAALTQSDEESRVPEAVLSLPKKYKDAVYLFYYEGYTAPEISKITGKKKNTIYTTLSRARKLLRDKLGGDDFE